MCCWANRLDFGGRLTNEKRGEIIVPLLLFYRYVDVVRCGFENGIEFLEIHL